MINIRDKKINDFIWIATSQITVLLFNLILLKILTYELSIKDYGFYALCLTIVVFIKQVIYDPFSMVIGKELALRSSNSKNIFSDFSVVRYATDSAGIFIIIFISLFLILHYIFLELNGNSIALFVCSLYLLANGAQGVYLNALNAVRERRTAAFFLIIDSFMKLTGVIFFIYFFKSNANSVLASIAIGSIISILILRYYLNEKRNLKPYSEIKSKALFFEYFKLSLPILIPTLVISTKSVVDRWFIAGFIGLDGLAAHSVLMQIGFFPIILAFGVVQTYLGPVIYELCTIKNIKKLQKLIMYLILTTFLFSVVAGLATLLLSDFIFKILVGESYAQYSKYLPIFVIAASVTAAAAVMQNVIFGYFNTNKSGAIIFWSNIIGMFFAILLIYNYNFDGASLGLVVMGLVPLVMYILIVLYKLSKIRVCE